MKIRFVILLCVMLCLLGFICGALVGAINSTGVPLVQIRTNTPYVTKTLDKNYVIMAKCFNGEQGEGKLYDINYLRNNIPVLFSEGDKVPDGFCLLHKDEKLTLVVFEDDSRYEYES